MLLVVDNFVFLADKSRLVVHHLGADLLAVMA